MRHVEKNKAGYAQNHLSDYNKGAVLSESAVGLVNNKSDKRVCHAVPQTHNHGKAGCHYYCDSDKACQVVGNIAHEEQIQVCGGVVQSKAPDTPQRNAMDTVLAIIL